VARALDGPLVVVSLYGDGERVTDAPGQALARMMEKPITPLAASAAWVTRNGTCKPL